MNTDADLTRPEVRRLRARIPPSRSHAVSSGRNGVDFADLLARLAARRTLLMTAFVAGGLAGFTAASMSTQIFIARVAFLVPQAPAIAASRPDESAGMLALRAQLPTNSEDLDFELISSAVLLDRVVDAFDLVRVYDVRGRDEARKELQERERVAVGRKDHLFTIEVEDTDPTRAAAMANRHAEEFRRLKAGLAAAQARWRRVLFESQVEETTTRLAGAQSVLQASGFGDTALRSAPMQLVGAQSTLQAQIALAEVQLRILREALAPSNPEVGRQQATLAALRAELSRLDAPTSANAVSAYLSDYREFKFEQTLLDLLAPEFELARAEESRPFALQIVDRALPPDRRSRPRRGLLSAASALLGVMLASGWVLARKPIPAPRVPTAAR